MTGDDDAARFAAFYREHYSLILSTCVRRLGDRPTAEDATAEVFRIIWQRYRRETPTLATLYAVARNVVGNEYRRAARARAVEDRLEQDVLSPSPNDDRAELREALLHLRVADRELLYMTYWEDLTANEIADILQSSPGAVWVRLTRARAVLRGMLLPEHDIKRGERCG